MRTRKQHFVSQILVGAARAIAVAAAMTFLLATAETGPAEAQTLTVLYRFKGPTDGDGAGPFAAPTLDNRHNLYGTTESGGSSNRGTVFKIDASGSETVLYSFTGGADGDGPIGSIVIDNKGVLYSTTSGGGSSFRGTVFKLDPFGNETVLYSFTGPAEDGFLPIGSLAVDRSGNLYGVTFYGGAPSGGGLGFGTVFKVDAAGNETVLHKFAGAINGDGATPAGGLIIDKHGTMYGTTTFGGSFDQGTVFKIDAAGNETVLYSFTGGADGFAPVGSLILDQHNNLYGTTSNGGADGWGTVFKLDPFGRKTVLYSFKGTADGDGAIPSGNLAMDNHGNLYGTTIVGGISDFGTAFKLDSSGKETVLHRFTGPDGDGSYLQAGLVFGRHGVLYGTTRGNGGSGISVFGTVFKVLP